MSKDSKFYLKQMEVGSMENFVYLVGDKSTKEIAVIDPSWNSAFIQETARKEGLSIKAVFVTHGHYDHINALEDIISKNNIAVYVSGEERNFQTTGIAQVKKTKSNDKIRIGNVEFLCIHTPGHTTGGQCFLADNCLFTGDTVFIDGCGRCDLAGGNAKAMYNSIHNIVMKLPDDTIIYPGHNYGSKPHDTLANQKKTNPYFQCKSLDEFLGRRMGF